MTDQEQKPNFLVEFLAKNAWALVIVATSVAAQWAVFGVRLDNLEARVDRQGTAITDIRSQVQETQNQYAALNAKVDALKDGVDYIRNRIDRALND